MMHAFVLDGSDSNGRVTAGERSYRFAGARGRCAWPMDEGSALGTAGMWNFLWRLGVHPRSCSVAQLPDPSGSILWSSFGGGESADELGTLRTWVRRGGYLVAEGNIASAISVFGWSQDTWTSATPENPYAGIAYVVPGRAPELVSPPRWSFAVAARPEAGVSSIGAIAMVQGERQTPSRATLVAAAGAPAIVAADNYCYLNARPFAGFQAWLQGQEDLQPWMAWRHRLFWLDEWVSAVASIISDRRALPSTLPRPGVRGLGATTVILRHDVDHSRDLSYINEEAARGLAATHGVLKDANARFWRDRVAAHPSHECAFHYNTGRRRWLLAARARLRRAAAADLAPDRRAVAGRGLHRQVRWAQRSGIGVATLLRHMQFLVYPEWVDALDYVFETTPDVLGANSLFRARVARWGIDRFDAAAGTAGEWPDPQFPLWFPFKLAHAGAAGRRLRGWEMTGVMEPEPELVDQLLSHRSAHLSQRVVTLGFHPAHARGTTFHRDGSLTSFRRVLDVVGAHQAGVRTFRQVFSAADTAALEAGITVTTAAEPVAAH